MFPSLSVGWFFYSSGVSIFHASTAVTRNTNCLYGACTDFSLSPRIYLCMQSLVYHLDNRHETLRSTKYLVVRDVACAGFMRTDRIVKYIPGTPYLDRLFIAKQFPTRDRTREKEAARARQREEGKCISPVSPSR